MRLSEDFENWAKAFYEETSMTKYENHHLLKGQYVVTHYQHALYGWQGAIETQTKHIAELNQTILNMLACINRIEDTIDYDDNAKEDIEYCIKKHKIDDIQRKNEEGFYEA
jgi:hypothetical protein